MAGKGQPMPNHYSTPNRGNKGGAKHINEISSVKHPIVFSLVNERQHQGVFVPFLLIDLLQDYASAILLSQMIYYTPRAKHPDGWIYKTAADLYNELRMSESVIKRCLYGDKRAPNRIALCDIGLEVKVMKANGVPTRHFRINTEVMEASLQRLIGQRESEGIVVNKSGLSTNRKDDNRQNSQANIAGTLTETTTETTTHIQQPDKPTARAPKKPTHQQAMAQAVVDAFGIDNPTRSDWRKAAKVGLELAEAGVSDELVAGLVQFVRNQAAGKWTVTMTSLTTNGRVSAYLAARNKSVTRDMSSGDDGIERVTMVTTDVEFETPEWLEELNDDDNG